MKRIPFEYLQDDYTWAPGDAASDYRDERTATHTDATGVVVARPNADGSTHEAADPMRSRPAPMLPPMATSRLADLTYEYDWLANEVLWDVTDQRRRDAPRTTPCRAHAPSANA